MGTLFGMPVFVVILGGIAVMGAMMTLIALAKYVLLPRDETERDEAMRSFNLDAPQV
jgi:uncharacterized integral membrane protein